VFQNFPGAKWIKQRRPKLFRNEEEQADDIPKPVRSKEEQTTYHKTIQE